MTKASLVSVSVSDQTIARDKLDVWKSWFNGIKHFFTVKVLPPRQ